eukprot:GFUD01025405.1.p1 GENE.GFUD01025405.1~~GFUD01025405.1.p1  ORF type:complete len:134 (+),score=15.51 GFUD01025405.1:36-437(+)
MGRITLIIACLLALGKADYDLDEMATAACTGMSVGHSKVGGVVAVRRQCSDLTADCNTVCQYAPVFSPWKLKTWSCFDSIHVYKNQPELGKRTGGPVETTAPPGVGKYGPVIYRYGRCHGGCGPNYCCCIGQK